MWSLVVSSLLRPLEHFEWKHIVHILARLFNGKTKANAAGKSCKRQAHALNESSGKRKMRGGQGNYTHILGNMICVKVSAVIKHSKSVIADVCVCAST
ncbi:hypothetical protein M5D96_008698 [Drosophila gunungcola]|uniref:Uncharacterized protein n=1 Tax=Drosophila gunungcola TaxID=103775 RepID=A0A9P9YLC0_9MUSC|nr:hypothetical protein M5D96_008698 [Drosophila gunungcola]